ncbi:MAG: ECF-type sigma factor [Acidobacteriota bacterium]
MLGTDAYNITGLLLAWRQGDDDALSELMPLVYRELKGLAGRLLRGEERGRALQPTELVHEVYLRVLELERIDWKDRAHFFAMCARLMRRILVDHARHRRRLKRGGDQQQVTTGVIRRVPVERSRELIALDEALTELAAKDREMARLVELRFFGGLNREEIAEVLELSSATVTRRWRTARAWLIRYTRVEQS